MRHGAGLDAENKAGDILHHADDVARIRELVIAHVRRADPDEADATATQLDELIAEWTQEAEIARGEGKRLYYKPQGRMHTSLLTDFGRQEGLWETPQSMRNVDRECLIVVRGA
jgi:hypothetical protein